MHPKHYKLRFQACMDQIFETSGPAGAAVATAAAGGRLVSRSTSSQSLPTLPEEVHRGEEVHNPLLVAGIASILAAAPIATTGAVTVASSAAVSALVPAAAPTDTVVAVDSKPTRAKKTKVKAADQAQVPPEPIVPAPTTEATVPTSLDDSFAEYSDMTDKTEYDML